MTYAVVRYSIRPESVEENRRLIENVFDELARAAPRSFGYAAIELGDGEFVHLVREADGASPLPQLAAFQAFLRDHAQRRVAPVDRSAARLIGNYNMLATGEAG